MRPRLRRNALLVVDLLLIAAATVLALLLRDNLEFSARRLDALQAYLATTLLVGALVLTMAGAHRHFWRFSTLNDYTRIAFAVIIIVLGSVALHFLIDRLAGVSRSLPIIQGLLMVFFLVGVRALARLHHLRRAQTRAGTPTQTAAGADTILVVGLNSVTELFLRSVDEFASDRMKVAGIVGRSERHNGRTMHRLPILGVPEDIDAIVKTLEVHGVLINRIVVTVAFSSLSADAQRELLALEDESNIRLDFFAERIGFAPSQTPPLAREEEIAADDVPLPQGDATLKLAAERGYYHFKRLADVVVAAILCCMLFPIFLLVSLLVAADVGLPVIFWQQRPGRHGRPFKLYKFRSMSSAHSTSGERIRDEERSSPIGNFLRRSRIDELPQLFNILIGDMSFVGPRPLLPSDQPPELAARLLVRPGLTGWAQVTGGRTISPLDKAALDLWYVRNASPWIDILTVCRTVPVILFGEQLDARALGRAWQELGLDLGCQGAVTPNSRLHHRAA